MKPEFILAINSSSVEKLDQGMNSVSLNLFTLMAQKDLIIGQREALEVNPAYRQIIPYICLAKTGEGGETLFYPYVRTKVSGEERLKGNVSIGFGGHIDLADVLHEGSVINLLETIGAAAARELEEEVDLSGGDEESCVDLFDNGLLIDDSNEVGKVHIGVVLTAMIPKVINPTSKEEALELLEPMTARQLLDSGLPLENWTKIVLEAVVNETAITGKVEA